MPQSLLLHSSMSVPLDMHNVPMDINGGPYLGLADKLHTATRDVITHVLGEPDTVALLRDDSTDTSSVGDIEVEGIITLNSIRPCCLMHL